MGAGAGWCEIAWWGEKVEYVHVLDLYHPCSLLGRNWKVHGSMSPSSCLWLCSHESKFSAQVEWSFELRSVHTREVIAIFELRSVHFKFNRIWGLAFQSGRRNVWVPCQSTCIELAFPVASVHMQRTVYRQKWLEGHVAPPPNHNLEVKAFIQRFCCVIWEMRNWKTTSGPWFELRISNDASRCNFAYTPYTVQNTVILMIIQIAQFEW